MFSSPTTSVQKKNEKIKKNDLLQERLRIVRENCLSGKKKEISGRKIIVRQK